MEVLVVVEGCVEPRRGTDRARTHCFACILRQTAERSRRKRPAGGGRTRRRQVVDKEEFDGAASCTVPDKAAVSTARRRWSCFSLCEAAGRADSNDASYYWGQIRTGSQGLTNQSRPALGRTAPAEGLFIVCSCISSSRWREILLAHCGPSRDST